MAEPLKEEPTKSFWSTLPGILTAVGGLVTAITALLTVLAATGVIGGEKATPTPVDAQVLLVETFDDPASGWSVETDADYEIGYRDGEYRMVVYRPELTIWSTPDTEQRYGDLLLEVDARQVEGPVDSGFGLAVRMQPGEESFYLFQIGADGTYAVDLMQAGEWLTLVEWTPSDAIRPGIGATNQLRVACNGASLSFYVNGSLLADLDDRTYTEGSIGLSAGTFEEGPVAVHFDNLRVLSLERP